ncbi:unnamed protein product [Brassica oleracea]
MDVSSSSSLASPQRGYDVFPSFRGPDVRQTFLSHLLNEFDRKGINTFKDSQIKRGKYISPELKQAIRESRICLIILSTNYASSSWTLGELDEILESRKASGKTVMTVFYDIDPSHVRKQSGEFGMAFRKTCERKTEHQKQRWKQALTNVASILGEDSHKWFGPLLETLCYHYPITIYIMSQRFSLLRDNEADMISKIAKDVSNELNFTPSRDFDYLVGIEAHLAKMTSLLCLESDETRVVGIWGPLGIGKTTIARAIYNQISRNFQRSLFMDNVKRSYRSGGDSDTYTLKLRLQREFLSKILDHKDMEIHHLGTAQQRLKYQKVLVVLDNVDKLEQLQALANGPPWFGKGSRIIVTTDNKHLLEAHKIKHIYEVKFPSKDEALKIFSQSAFTQNAPPEGYLNLAVKVTELTSHLPLGLCVLGKALCGESVSMWTDQLPRIKTSLNRDIEQVLIVGYNGLDDKDKAIFLHIACLFEGKRVDCVTQFLGNSGLDIEYGLGVLVGRALISILGDKLIIMHRLLRQMGREIVHKHSIHLSMRCRFLMGACYMYHVVADNIGTGAVLGTSKVSLTNEKVLSGMHDHQCIIFCRDMVDKGSKLAKLIWDGISVLVLSMFWLLRCAFLSIVSMPTAAFEHPFWKLKKRLSNLKPSKEVNCSVDGCKELGDISLHIS